MTSANFILFDKGDYHLFSRCGSACPSDLGELMGHCLAMLAGEASDIENVPGRVFEFLLRVDATYLYSIDTGTQQIRGWRSGHGAWQKTPYMILLAQINNELDLTEFSNLLPPGWKTLPPTDAQFDKWPQGHLRQAAWDRDREWSCMSRPSGGFSAAIMRFRLPLMPLEMPYRHPVYYQAERVEFLNKEGIWVQTTLGSWVNLRCIDYEQVGEEETKRLYIAWLESMKAAPSWCPLPEPRGFGPDAVTPGS